MKSYVTYFSFMFPVPFILVGWLFARLHEFGAKRGSRLTTVCTVVLSAVVCGQALYVERLYRFWDQEGGALGTRGENYEYQLAVSEAIAERAQTRNPIVTSDWPPQTPVHLGIQYLLWWKLRDRPLPAALPQGAPQTAFVVVDMRFRKDTDIPPPLDKLSYRSFGPERLYEIPIRAGEVP